MRTGERKCIALPRITARLILAKDPTTVPSRNLGFSRNGAALVQDHPFAFGQRDAYWAIRSFQVALVCVTLVNSVYV